MKYYLYHIPGKKIGVTRDLKERVENQQGYNEDEYTILMETDDILQVSNAEILMQKAFGYKVDVVPYNKLKFNKQMKINVTEATTTFPCPVKKLKGRLMDNIGMRWETEHGELDITPNTIRWIMKNVKVSMYDSERSYVYNKAFARYYDNNNVHETLTGGLSPTGPRSMDCKEYESHNPEEHGMPPCCNYDDPCTTPKGSKHDCVNSGSFNEFDLIRMWANQRGIYEHGDTKTQALKLMEEAGEICRAVLKEDHDEVVDGIGDCVVVLTNLAELQGVSIEKCINVAYNVIAQRSGKMVNGTFKKD